MNNKLYYVCKYTPLELLAAFGAQCENLNHMPEGFDTADQIAHPNICGFGKSVLEAVLAGDVRELVLVNCCDTIRSVYDLLQEAQPSETSRVDDTAEAALRFEQGQDGLPEEVVQMDFLYMLDMLHCGNDCSRERVAAQLKDLAKKYGEYKGRTFDPETFRAAFAMPQTASTEKAGATARLQPHIAVLGARMGEELFEMAVQQMPLPLVNETCVYNRSVTWTYEGDLQDFDSLMDWYAGELLGQIPCMRMVDNTGRRQLYQDPSLKGIIYHTVKFCDFYSFEYAQIKAHTDVPLLKIESDYTVQSSGQLLTRFEAFAESLSLNPQTAEAIREFHESAQNTGVGCGFNDGEQGVKANRRFSRGGRITGVIPGSVGDQSETGGMCGGCARTSGGKGESCLETSGEMDTEGTFVRPGADGRKERHMGKGYFAGIDSGSTSTDVVIINKERKIVASIILPTGAGAAIGAERALEQALQKASLARGDIDAVVTTGYGRTAIQDQDKSITEITCHARGAHFLDPSVRTVVDIGGQDSKVIRLDADGSVKNFVMNDKCAAGTGRFLEMMARTMEMSLDEIGKAGLTYDEDITISSMCTVFAESEVVSLIAQNKKPDDIVHGLNKAVAAKTASLVKRVGGAETYMMTGGVAQNQGLVKTLEERLNTKLVISDKAQLCGALGAALYAADMGM